MAALEAGGERALRGRPEGVGTEPALSVEAWRDATTRVRSDLDHRAATTREEGHRPHRARVLFGFAAMLIVSMGGAWLLGNTEPADEPRSTEAPKAAPSSAPPDPPPPRTNAPAPTTPARPTPSAAPEANPAPKRAKAPRPRSKRPTQRVPASAEPSVPVAARATLTVLAEPYANIRLDGEPIGPTPRYGLETTAGEHVLELIHPADGSVRHRVELSLRPNEQRKVRAPPL